jgi:hypothetical protein
MTWSLRNVIRTKPGECPCGSGQYLDPTAEPKQGGFGCGLCPYEDEINERKFVCMCCEGCRRECALNI